MSREAVLNELYTTLDRITHDGTNSAIYRAIFDKMDDTEYKQFFIDVKAKTRKLPIFVPNHGKARMEIKTILAEAERIGMRFFDTLRLTIDDVVVDSQEEFWILMAPVRRLAQTIETKMSISDDDTKVDGLTGQVRGDSKSASIGLSELAVLTDGKLPRVSAELATVRGGDAGAYNYLKAATVATGGASLTGAMNSRTGVGSRRMVRTFLLAKHIGNNL